MLLTTLEKKGLERFHALQADAVDTVAGRFYQAHMAIYGQLWACGRQACHEEIKLHLEFLRPALEFGLLQPLVDYLVWLDNMLSVRAIPVAHIAESLEYLADFFSGHMEAADAKVVNTALLAARDTYLASRGAKPAPPQPPKPWPETAAFEAALLDGNQKGALAIVNCCIDDGHNLIDIELHIIQAALYHIGEKWQSNLVSVAKEHMATAIAQSVMTTGLLRSTQSGQTGKRVLLACVEGNYHAVGLRMVADAFLLGGWDVHYLGENVPSLTLIQEAKEWKPDVVGLSVALAHHLHAVKETITQLRQQPGDARPFVMVGGLAINRFEKLAKTLGADACGKDAQAALIHANRIIG